MTRACLVQFEAIEVIEHVSFLIRSRKQMERAIARIAETPGLVLFTIVDEDLRTVLEEGCRRLRVPCIPVLDPVIAAMGTYLGAKSRGQAGRQHVLDAEYFSRIDAMHFALLHDDGQAYWELNEADVVILGVSRTSKTPTCMYLANRGIKAANIPLVTGVPLPDDLDRLTVPLIVGLTKDPERLVQVRRSRLLGLNQRDNTDYVDPERVRAEVTEARRLYSERRWPVIDVTRRSIEEVAAAILKLYAKHRGIDDHKIRTA